MLCIALFVDNLERCHYNIPFVTENWDADRNIVFTGNHYTTATLKEAFNKSYDKIEVIQLSNRITTPSDISKAFNASVNYCYERMNADAVIYFHADAYVTEGGMKRFLQHYEYKQPAAISYIACQLYSKLWSYPTGAVLSFKHNRSYFDENEDGMAMKFAPKLFDDDHSLVLDIGYLTIAEYTNKMFAHNSIWPDDYKTKVLDEFRKSTDAGLRMAYRKIHEVKQCALEVITEAYYAPIYDRFNLWDEYHHCMKIMGEI